MWSASLTSGDPVEGVDLEMIHGARATSGPDGLGSLALPDSVPADADGYTEQQIVVARKGKDLAILPESSSWYGGGSWVEQAQLDQLAWFVFDDRGIYRPKEKVRVKGWLRRQETRTHGDIGGLGADGPSSIHWTLTSSTGNPMGEGDTKLSRLGGFDLGFEIPDTANLGTAQLTLVAQGSSLSWATWTHAIEIEEFRRPEFEVTTTGPEGRWTLGEEATFTVDAHYYAGGGLPDADVSWNVSATPTSYSPPGHDGFSFGKWIPWWGHEPWGHGRWGRDEARTAESLEAKTDASGKHAVAAHFIAVNPPRPTNVIAEASVMDVNRQRWTSSATLLVHPAAIYVGLRTEKAFVDKGDRIDVDVLTVDPDGKATGADVTVRAVRHDWGFVRGAWAEVEKDPQDCTLPASTSLGHCQFEAKSGGRWSITATVRDERGRKNESELSIWVTGGDATPDRSLTREEVTLVPEKELYAPGETARLFVQAPFAPAEGTLTIERSGIVRQTRFRMDEATTTLEVAILEEHIPNVTVQVDLVGLQTRTGERRRQAYGSGQAIGVRLWLDLVPGVDARAEARGRGAAGCREARAGRQDDDRDRSEGQRERARVRRGAHRRRRRRVGAGAHAVPAPRSARGLLRRAIDRHADDGSARGDLARRSRHGIRCGHAHGRRRQRWRRPAPRAALDGHGGGCRRADARDGDGEGRIQGDAQPEERDDETGGADGAPCPFGHHAHRPPHELRRARVVRSRGAHRCQGPRVGGCSRSPTRSRATG